MSLAKKMDSHIDFITHLPHGLAIKIMTCLDHPHDLVRAALVSRHWKAVLVNNGHSKKLCFRRYPQFSSISEVEMSNTLGKDMLEMPLKEKVHVAYAALVGAPANFEDEVCALTSLSASSFSSRYPVNRNRKTLGISSVWCSQGSLSPQDPENLIYKLHFRLCYITQINLAAFQDTQLAVEPVFAAGSVRFRMGVPKDDFFYQRNKQYIPQRESAEDDIYWLYTSKTFPMEQHSQVQRFVLDDPCKMFIGGILQIQFFDRVQTDPRDNRYYIGISQLRVIGRTIPEHCFAFGFSPTNGWPTRLSFDAGTYKFRHLWLPIEGHEYLH